MDNLKILNTIEQLKFSIDMANEIEDKTIDGIEAILDSALSRKKDGSWIVKDKQAMQVYCLANVYVDKILILEVATILEKKFKDLIQSQNIKAGWFRGYQ